MRRLVLFIPLIMLLVACLPALASDPQPALPTVFSQVTDRWQADVVGDQIAVRRHIEIDEDLSNLLRGSPSLNAGSLSAILTESGSIEVRCQLSDSAPVIVIDCSYHYLLQESDTSMLQVFRLPQDTLLYFLADIPVDSAHGLNVQTAGEAETAGVFVQIPNPVFQMSPNNGYVLRRYELKSLSNLTIFAEQQIPPGNLLAFYDNIPTMAGFLPNYFPRPSAWLALGLALVSTLVVLGQVFQVKARLQLAPQPWRPDINHLPRFLHALFNQIVRFFNWLQQNWPRAFILTLGSSLILIGGFLLYLAWNLAIVYEQSHSLRMLLNEMFASLPLTGLMETLLWPEWPVVVGLCGGIVLLIGLGLLARREIARLTLSGVGAAMLGGLILGWPHLLLAPPLINAQLELVLWLGLGILASLAIFIRFLNHPQLRLYYLGG